MTVLLRGIAGPALPAQTLVKQTKNRNNNVISKRWLGTVSAAALAAAFSFGAVGTSFAAIDQITVTTRKRAESLQQTPIAITAFTGDSLRERGLTSLMEVGSFAPNVKMNISPGGSGAGHNSQIYIRGLGQSDFLFTTDPAVGTYIDGVYHPRTLGGNMDLLDIERIEIARGPQGTLFGKNTIGGAVSIISAKPTGETGGYAELTIGKFDRIDGRGSFDFPIVEDKLFAKVSFSSKNRDGYGKRLDFNTGALIDRSGSDNEAAGRLALRYLPTEDITVDLTADVSRLREESPPITLLAADPAGGLPITFWNAFVSPSFGSIYDDRFITGDPDVSFGTGPNENTLDAWGLGLTIEWDAGPVTIKSITAYREMEASFGRDGDGSPLPIVQTNQRQDQDQISQELQILGDSFDDRLHWVLGGFYFNEFGRDDNDVVLTSGLFGALETLGIFGPPGNAVNIAFDLDFDVFNEIDITSYAFFTHNVFDLTDKLSLSGGARLTYEKKDYFSNHFRVASLVPLIFEKRVKDNWTAVTYDGGVDYQATDDMLVYAKASRGFKSGGFNGRPINDGSVGSYDPEFLFAVEGGVKADWWDNRLRTNLAVFYNDYKDIQLTAVTTDSFGALAILVSNAGTAESFGVELEVEVEPIDGLNIQASLGYLDIEYKTISAIAAADGLTLQDKLQRAPELTSSISAEYSIPVQDYGFLKIRGDWAYTARSELSVKNVPLLRERPHSIVNGRIAFEDPDNGWEIAAFMTNMTDIRVIRGGVSALSSFGTLEGIFNRPREWGVSIKKTF